MAGPFTVVSFHAHPDDEALLTSGTLARAAAEGHRVVLVVATSGEAGLSAGDMSDLGDVRRAELQRSADALGCARVVLLGYPDSGLHGEHGGFATMDPSEAAARLAEVLIQERADVLTSYDPNGGYGHPDHVQVHHVGRLAAELARTPIVLEATIDREALIRAARLVSWTRLAPPDFSPARLSGAYSDRATITHRVDVSGHLDRKRASMAAHATQARGGQDQRTLAFFLKLPRPLFRLAFRREWFSQPGRAPGASSDIFDSLR